MERPIQSSDKGVITPGRCSVARSSDLSLVRTSGKHEETYSGAQGYPHVRSSDPRRGSIFSQECALHWPYGSLDRFGRLRCVLASLQVDLQPLWASKAPLVCWLGVIFNINILFGDSARESEAIQEQIY
jgi:hypothetical protein